MNKELIDKAWHCLPREFKEEVKKLAQYYSRHISALFGMERQRADKFYREFVSLFGIDNLTSDAEGEEMLTVNRKAVLVSYDYHKSRGHHLTADTLYDLFGSKCLPDEVGNEVNFASKEPKPAEPEFKVGYVVRYVGDMQPTYKGKTFVIDGEVFFNDYYNQWQTRSIKPFAWDGLSVCNVPLTDLEPYTEPEEDKAEEIAGKAISLVEEYFDSIIKRGFSKERRLNVAAMAMQGLLANSHQELVDMKIEQVAQLSLEMTDALIAEAEKGNSDGGD